MRAQKQARKQTRVAGPSTLGMRSCIGCRERFPRESLVRLVCDPEGVVVVDRHLKAPGRGAHVCYVAACMHEAVRRKAFGRAFKRPVVQVDPARLVTAVVEAIDTRIRDGLCIGRRAGWTCSGMDVLERARSRSRLLLVVLAEDAAPATADRVRRWGDPERCPVIVYGSRHLLGVTQGQAERVAIGVTHPDLAHRLQLEFKRRDRVLVAG